MSIHKNNEGSFYPGISGKVENVGSGQGKGFNLNFPINQNDNQFIGD